MTKIVLLHGLGVDGRMWSRQLGNLQEISQLLALDLPGFGSCPPLDPPNRRIEVYVDWIASRLRESFSAPVAVAGYSMGGSLAVYLTLRHPGLVSKLALCCTSPCWGRGWRHYIAELFSGLGRESAMELFQCSIRVSSRRFIHDPEEWAEMTAMLRLAHRPTMLALYHQLAELDLRVCLPRVPVPSLVIGGTRDWLAPPSHAQILRDGLPRARLAMVRGATHLLCLSHSMLFSKLLMEFFS